LNSFCSVRLVSAPIVEVNGLLETRLVVVRGSSSAIESIADAKLVLD
jgi:hypothetical protein